MLEAVSIDNDRVRVPDIGLELPRASKLCLGNTKAAQKQLHLSQADLDFHELN
jgi:hypothetical protein